MLDRYFKQGLDDTSGEVLSTSPFQMCVFSVVTMGNRLTISFFVVILPTLCGVDSSLSVAFYGAF